MMGAEELGRWANLVREGAMKTGTYKEQTQIPVWHTDWMHKV